MLINTEDDMREIKVYFEAGELTEVEFNDGLSGEVRRCVRGKSGGAYRSAGSFQWTSAVRGLASLLVQTVLLPNEAVIEGGAGTLAASLDYAISKQPMWLTDMFGCDQQGICMIRRMVLRTNAERKRPGPTVLSVNQRYMPVESIKIIADGKPATRENLVVLIAMLMIDKAAKEQNDGMALAA
jgi:hypothetical protein